MWYLWNVDEAVRSAFLGLADIETVATTYLSVESCLVFIGHEHCH